MKRTFISLSLTLLLGAFLALGSFNITVQAAGTQQTEEYVAVTLTAYFDPSNIINTNFPVPVEDDMWFDEATNKLYTFGASDWDAGVELPTSVPGSPGIGDKWFDESTNTLYTYGESAWDAGVELPVADPSLTYGQTLSFASDIGTMENHTFLYWEVNNSINYLPVDYQFSLTETNVLKAVFSPSDKHVVSFVDSNGHILKIEYVDNNASATVPETLPTKLGYSVSGWSLPYTGVTDDVVTVLQYTATNTSDYTVTVNSGSGSGDYTYNTVATVTASAPAEGYYFHHWEVEDLTLSYQSTYSFTVVENTEISAYYSTSPVTDAPTVAITNDLGLRSGYKTFIGQFYLPSGYSLIEYGILTTSSATALIDLSSSSVIRNQATKYNGSTNEYVMSIVDGNNASYRGYMICKDTENQLVTVYSETAYNVYNGGFELGNLTGWNYYRIWKDETGIDAFDSSLVTTGTYFSSYPYNRDGSYNLGITGGSIAWEQAAERMVHLRSSDFVLGGSGWVSFKLGGGKWDEFAYVSIRKTSDNTEVARFGNKNFNNTGIATTQYGSSISNAEAFLFQYYFNLASVGTLGDSYYFVLSDTAAYDWSILSADSFISFIPVAPSPSADETATNILPSVLGIGSVSNTIVNGNFDSDLSNWTDLNSNFKWDSTRAYSNKNGDGDIGIIQSSAFDITTNNCLEIWWGGGLKHDKRIFISIKEVGTNIEVLRYVRRDDKSNYEDTAPSRHILDLSSLDSSKLYYVEFNDNKSDGWGMLDVDQVFLISKSTYDGIASNYRAVQILNSSPNFVYVKP